MQSAFGIVDEVHPAEHGGFIAVAVFDASRFKVLKNPVGEALHIAHIGIGRIELLGRQGLKALQRLDREGACHAQLFLVLLGLVKQGFGIRRLAIGQAFERDVRHRLVNKAVAYVAGCRVGQLVPRVGGGHEARLGDVERNAAGIGGDPATPPLLGHMRRGAAAASRVQHQVARVGGH